MEFQTVYTIVAELTTLEPDYRQVDNQNGLRNQTDRISNGNMSVILIRIPFMRRSFAL
jgi:hypothetical protein